MPAQFYLFVQTETACFCIEYFLQPHVYFHFYTLPHVKRLVLNIWLGELKFIGKENQSHAVD